MRPYHPSDGGADLQSVKPIKIPVVNLQPPEKRVDLDDGTLDVVNIWHTIQGEGPYAGRPAVFVRLAGCNLQCQGCDTDYTTNRQRLDTSRVLDEVSKFIEIKYTSTRLVVITGGEPFRQPIGNLILGLHKLGYLVQVETNGTLMDPTLQKHAHDLWGRIDLVCSPKTPKLNPELMPWISHLKYIVQSGRIDSDGLPLESLESGVRPARPWGDFLGNIYVQPYDEQDPEKNKANLDAAVQSCLKHGYMLSLQTHKIIGLQ